MFVLHLASVAFGYRWLRCAGAGVSEWTPAGVLTIFENRSGADGDFSKEGPEQEWSGSQLVIRV